MSQRINASAFLALVVVVGAFLYFIFRGGNDAAVTAIMAGALGTVLSYFFASHIADGAADKALNNRIASTASHDVVIAAQPHDTEV